MSTLVLLRHGQSTFNRENRFTGWVDVPLTDQGRREAEAAAGALGGVPIDTAFCSRLSRTEETVAIVLRRLGLAVPVVKDSALNERIYGDLQGLNKDDIAARYGVERVRRWRRDYFTRPPNGESLEDCERRALPFFLRYVLPDVRGGKNVLVVAHGNSIRPIRRYLERLDPREIGAQEIAFCRPYTYVVDDESIRPITIP